jgi:hypothetical protein
LLDGGTFDSEFFQTFGSAVLNGYVNISDDGTNTTINVDLNGGNNNIDYTIVLDGTVENALSLAGGNIVVD